MRTWARVACLVWGCNFGCAGFGGSERCRTPSMLGSSCVEHGWERFSEGEQEYCHVPHSIYQFLMPCSGWAMSIGLWLILPLTPQGSPPCNAYGNTIQTKAKV